MLPESSDRILATSITSTWKYSTQPSCYDAAFNAAKQAIIDLCFGPPQSGVYSPSVQYTVYHMGTAVLERVPQVSTSRDDTALGRPLIFVLQCCMLFGCALWPGRVRVLQLPQPALHTLRARDVYVRQ